MTTRWKRRAALAGLALLLVTLAARGDEKPRAGFAEDYLRFSYRTETAGGLIETITTEITPTSDGRYQVVTTTEQVTGPDEIRLGFFGGSLRWLGLYMSGDAGDRFDISSLDALADQVLEPHKRYMLPDGGLLQTGGRVTVAGLPGIEGIFTHADAEGMTITIVFADDVSVRQLLPFPLRVRLEYDEAVARSTGEDPTLTATYFSGTVELVEFTRTRDDGGIP